MKDAHMICNEFQISVENCLMRHKSILDVLTKNQETSSRINRALAKSVTECGCLQINAVKQQIPSEIKLQDLGSYMKTHLDGSLCDECKDVLMQEMGNHLFYLVALCNLLGLDLYDILWSENEKLSTLGIYNLS